MNKDEHILLLEKNIKELQGQLTTAQKRILELNKIVDEGYETIKKHQAQLSFYKNESL